MKKRTKESKKRINSLILLIAFTMILMITSTYAWFSTQKDILLSNIEGTVNVAEGLEVSLDGKTWGNEINLRDLVTHSTTKEHESTNDPLTGKIVVPNELFPVSTAGEIGDGKPGEGRLQFFRGKVSKKVELSDVVKVKDLYAPEDTIDQKDFGGYIAFDMYLKNTNKTTSDGPANTILQLNKNSMASDKSVKDSGLENAIRVGFAKYTTTMDTLSTQDEINSQDFGAIDNVAIWEPNSKSHVEYLVNNSAHLHPAASKQEASGRKYYGITKAAVGGETAITGGKKITNIYEPTEGDKKVLKEIKTVQTNLITNSKSPEKGVDEGVQNLTNVDGGNFEIEKNKITKIRVYVWLEGGDIDCINYASHGEGIKVQIGLIKDVVIPSGDLGQV